MIYPTRRAVAITAAGAPLALLVGLATPAWWTLAPAWIGACIALVLLDALLGASPSGVSLDLSAPAQLAVGRAGERVGLEVGFAGLKRAPARVEAALGTNAKLTAGPVGATASVVGAAARLAFQLSPVRRGEGVIEQAWTRWTGPLGLVHLQRTERLNRRVPVTLDIAEVKTQALRLFARDALHGLKNQIERGDGTEFHALHEHQIGHDPRAIDWKQSARHGQLLSKEFRSERNHPVILAVDSGRLMSEPLGDVPKLDRALNAALLLAYVSLKLGDRVGLFAFDDRPRTASKTVAGTAAFPLVQRVAAGIDYSAEETNFTLGLSTLASELDRRALVVVFTDFADSTSAELMLENLGRLLKRHRVLFVLFEDETLEALTRAEPRTPADISRAVVADALLREREVVVARLRRLGADIVEAPADRVGPALIDRYLALKRRDQL